VPRRRYAMQSTTQRARVCHPRLCLDDAVCVHDCLCRQNLNEKD
jgi:hypothetical protein